MTFEEIRNIPDLQLEVTELAEDCFYVKMSSLGRISDEVGRKTYDRIKGRYSEEELKKALDTADKMIENINKYGVACAEWV